MKKHRHLWIAMTVIAVGGALLTACGGGSPAPTSVPTPAATPTTSADEYLDQGIEYAEQGRLDEAIAAFQRAIELEPDNAHAYRNLGTAYNDQGLLEEAAAAYEQAIALDPEYGEAYCDLAGVYYYLDRLDDAVAAGEQGLSLAPAYPAGHVTMGAIYFSLGRTEEAILQWEEAVRLDPNDDMARSNLGFAYLNQGRLYEAMGQLEEAIELNPDNPLPHDNLGYVYAELGRTEEAIAEFQTYLQLRPDAPDRAQVEEMIAQLEGAAVDLGAEYTSPVGFTVRYPSDWVHIELGEDQVMFLRSQEDMERVITEAPVISLVNGPLDELGESLDLGEITSVEQALQGGLAHFEAEGGEMATFEVMGYPAGLVEMSGTFDGVPFRGGLAFVFVEDWGFAFTGMAPPDQWDQVAPTFEGMVRSLSFPGP